MMIAEECICEDQINGMPRQMSYVLGSELNTCPTVNDKPGSTTREMVNIGKPLSRIVDQNDSMCLDQVKSQLKLMTQNY